MAAKPQSIIFVCTGNICRSPMASVLLRHALEAEDEPYSSISTGSAGVSAMNGQPASANSVEAMRKVGLSLANHRSRQLTPSILDDAMAVFCMTESHRDVIRHQFDKVPEHLYLMREFMPDSDELEIPDPFGGNLRLYEHCRDSMVEAVPSLLQVIRRISRQS